MAFYELSLYGTYFQQRCVNVFNFVSIGEPATVTGSFGLAAAFGAVRSGGDFGAGSILDQIQAIVTNDFIFNQVRVLNPHDDTDFYSAPFPAGVTGDQMTASQSPFEAWSVRSNQTRLDIQAGQKRFAGVPAVFVNEGGTVSTDGQTILQELCDRMSEPITYDDEGNTLTYNLVVAKKLEYTAPSGKPAYKYYPTLAAQMAQVASGILWTPRPYLSSQVTRQYGHGR